MSLLGRAALTVCVVSGFVFSSLAASHGGIAEAHPSDLVIDGGPMYMAWPATDSVMTCGLTILSPGEKVERRKPVMVIVVIDVSRSMQGEPLGSAKKAAKVVVEALGDDDVFGLVAFSSYARVAFPMQPLNSGVRPGAHAAINALGDEDRRNTLVGMTKALEQFERLKGRDVVGRHAFLVTNGDANHGVTDPEKILADVVSLAERSDVCVSTFGFKYFDRTSDDFDEDLLWSIAERTRGRYYFIDETGDMAPRFGEEANRVCNANARSIRVSIVAPGRSSRITNVEGGIVENDGIFVGDMAPGAMRIVVFDIEGRPKRQRDCEVIATYLESDRQGQREVRTYLDIPLTGGSTRLSPKAAPRLVVYDLQASLVETVDELVANRKEYTLVFRDKVRGLEQENVILDSDYVRDMLRYYEGFERILDNSTIEAPVVIKHIKYRAQQILLGR
jgi:hypothetical protein